MVLLVVKSRFLLPLLLLSTGLRFSIPQALAATFNPSDAIGLNNAILASNSNGEDDEINLGLFRTYTLTTQLFTTTGFTGLPRIAPDGGHTLTILGVFSTIERSSAAGTPAFRIFDIDVGAQVLLSNFTIRNGKAVGVGGGGGPQYDEGGAIYNRGTLTLQGITFTENSAAGSGSNRFNGGGAISNLSGATLLVQYCQFTNNSTTNAGFSPVHGGGAISNLGNNFAVDHSTFTNNSCPLDGGAIRNYSPNGFTFSITDSTFSGNTASQGGGIHSAGNSIFTLTRCAFSGNSASAGGAIYNLNGADYTMTGCLFTNNTASAAGSNYGGGAIYNGQSVTATRCTFNGNSAGAGDGGGITSATGPGGANSSPVVVTMLNNCTFSGNSATRGGGIANSAFDSGNVASLSVTNCTFSGNAASQSGGGIYWRATNFGPSTASVVLANTILKAGASGSNLARANFAGESITSQGHNLSSDAAGGDGTIAPGGFLNVAGDIRNTDPQLAALANNGGPIQTLTHALLSTSPAINAGNDMLAPSRDQRFYLRSGASDIGAFEFGGTLAPLDTFSRKSHGATTPPLIFDLPLPITGTAGVECRTGGLNGDHQVIMTLPFSVSISNASVTSGIGSVSSYTNLGTQVTLNLTGVTNVQRIVITLSDVSDGVNTNNFSLPMGILLGDTTGSGAVSSSDIGQTKAQSGQPVTAANFRTDVTVSGTINASDIGLVKSRSGTQLP